MRFFFRMSIVNRSTSRSSRVLRDPILCFESDSALLILRCPWYPSLMSGPDKLQSILMLKESRQDWTMNFITDLSSSKRWNKAYDSILIVIDRYTKYARYIRARKNWTAVQLTDVLVKELFTKLEISVFIITDRESLFIVNYWFVFCYHFKSALRYSTAFHSQTDEQTERQNQILKQYLRSYVNYQ
jgi:hypothetical protein